MRGRRNIHIFYFILRWEELHVVCSMLDKPAKTEMNNLLDEIDGTKLKNQMTSATTHLAMTSISLSLKVLCDTSGFGSSLQKIGGRL